MTVIVWDGTTLAADKQATKAGLKFRTTKIHRVGDNLVGYSGDLDYAQAMVHWIRDGCKPDQFPKHQEDDAKWVSMIVVTPDKRVLKYERSPYPMDITEAGVFCFGAGRDYAYGAMAMGADAVTAVEIACRYEESCGMGIDSLTVEGE